MGKNEKQKQQTRKVVMGKGRRLTVRMTLRNLESLQNAMRASHTVCLPQANALHACNEVYLHRPDHAEKCEKFVNLLVGCMRQARRHERGDSVLFNLLQMLNRRQ